MLSARVSIIVSGRRQCVLVQFVPGLWKDSANNQLVSEPSSEGGDAPKRNAEHHEDGAGALDEHHGNAERTDEAQAVGVHELGCVLQGR